MYYGSIKTSKGKKFRRKTFWRKEEDASLWLIILYPDNWISLLTLMLKAVLQLFVLRSKIVCVLQVQDSHSSYILREVMVTVILYEH